MKQWTPEQVAQAAGARLIASAVSGGGPERVTVDSRDAGPGALFVGLPGASHDGGSFAVPALASGAWGILTTPEHAVHAARAGDAGAARAAADAHPTDAHLNDAHANDAHAPATLLAASDPLRALGCLATAWRRELGARVIGVTGSTGKTSTKDLLLALLSPHRRTVASRANFNTEIGLPLEILAAPAETEVLVLEMGMRGPGQIMELAQIAEPDVGLIVSVGPVHLERLGTVEAIAAAKAELIAALAPGATAIVPAGERLLGPHLRADVTTVTFGPGGDVRLLGQDAEHVVIQAQSRRIELDVPFAQAHLRVNLLAAVAAARAVGVTPRGRVALVLSAGRGQRLTLPGAITVIDDCYNANPMSMRAALSDLAASAPRAGGARRVAVLGDMLELGPDEVVYHERLGEQANAAGVDVLVTVGPLAAASAARYDGEAHAVADAGAAAAVVPELLQAGDVVLVKASRGVGLEVVCRALSAAVTA